MTMKMTTLIALFIVFTLLHNHNTNADSSTESLGDDDDMTQYVLGAPEIAAVEETVLDAVTEKGRGSEQEDRYSDVYDDFNNFSKDDMVTENKTKDLHDHGPTSEQNETKKPTKSKTAILKASLKDHGPSGIHLKIEKNFRLLGNDSESEESTENFEDNNSKPGNSSSSSFQPTSNGTFFLTLFFLYFIIC